MLGGHSAAQAIEHVKPPHPEGRGYLGPRAVYFSDLPVEAINRDCPTGNELLTRPGTVSVEPPQLRAAIAEVLDSWEPSRWKTPIENHPRSEFLHRGDQRTGAAAVPKETPWIGESERVANSSVLEFDMDEAVLMRQPPAERSLPGCRNAGDKNDPLLREPTWSRG